MYLADELTLSVPNLRVRCGNDVDIPGAFELTGRDAMDVCLVLDAKEPVTEARLRAPAAEHTIFRKRASPGRRERALPSEASRRPDTSP